jgi:hypothetical protein
VCIQRPNTLGGLANGNELANRQLVLSLELLLALVVVGFVCISPCRISRSPDTIPVSGTVMPRMCS